MFGLTSGILKDQKRFVKITGTLDLCRRDNPNEMVFNKEFYGEHEIIGSKRVIFLPLFLDSVSTRATESFLARMKLTVQDKLDDGRWASESTELWWRMDPIKNSEPYSGLKVTPLGPEGVELANPILAHGNTYYFYEDILYRKSEIQKNLQRQAAKEQKSKALIGSRVTNLQMAFIPGSEGLKEISIPQRGRTVVIAGASWCGPCRGLDPKVKEYAAYLASSGSGTKVFKVSIEDEKVQGGDVGSAEFEEEFPNGVLTKQQQEDFVIEMVPWFLLIEDGVIVQQGVLSEAKLGEFQKLERSSPTVP
jgi:thiol-disulfide isomerase/thioredoxin